jgi:hypothetical protein
MAASTRVAWGASDAVEAKEFPSFAALARHEGMAPQRVAQILDLTLLAPDTGPLTRRPPSR